MTIRPRTLTVKYLSKVTHFINAQLFVICILKGSSGNALLKTIKYVIL